MTAPSGSAPASHPSLAGRALLAVALLVGFYLLAIAIAAGLLYLPYGEWRLTGRVLARPAIFAVVGAGIILWSILPRVDKFTPPGPEIRPARAPRLFDLVRRIAHATGQAMPASVYLVPDVNAWVAQRGGVMGVGSRRIMGLGLPLMARLTVAQFAAVLAHEFGHYHGGDTALGPWIYKTRAAIGRTLQNLSRHSGLLMKPFQWYGTMFIRITHAVSRAQEYGADALAAGVVGSQPLIEGLKVVHATAPVFDAYWQQEFGPVLQSGFRAPFQEGFGAFAASPAITAAVAAMMEHELTASHADPADTHPPLAERIGALDPQPTRPEWADDAPAITLLDDPGALERELIDGLVGPRAGELKTIAWSDVPRTVWAPIWRSEVEGQVHRFTGATPASLGSVSGPPALAVALRLAATEGVTTPEHAGQAQHLFGCALATVLLERGWDLEAAPGDRVTLSHGPDRVCPFALFRQFEAGELTHRAWRDLCARTGLDQFDLAEALRRPGRD